MSMPTDREISQLTNYDTPTICNALELIIPERRGYGFTTKPFSCLYPAMKPIVGFAKTAKIRAASPDERTDASRLSYYEYVAADGSSDHNLVVIEDVDPHPGTGAFWGEVHTAVHKGLGLQGVVTNGSYRDVADSAEGFQVIGGMVNPSHAFVYPLEFGTPVTVHGMSVTHGDIVHADRHGAVVVPHDAVAKIPDAVDLIVRKESKILDAARQPGFGIDALRQALSEAADIH